MTFKNSPTVKNKIIICGFGHIGKSVFDLLKKFSFEIIIITNTPLDPELINEKLEGVTYIHGDARSDEILKMAGVHQAMAILALTDKDMVNLSIAIDAKKLNSNIQVLIRMFDYELGASLKKDLGIQEIYSATHLSAPFFIPNSSHLPRLGELEINNEHYTLYLGETSNSSIPENTFVDSISLSSGRILIKKNIQNLKSLNWVHFFSFFHRSTTISFKVIFLVFLLVIIFSTFLISNQMELGLLDSLYFTITTISTVGYGDHNFSQASSLMKVYGIFLMFFGTAVLASLFSLITDFILTEKLKNFFGSYQIPEKNHHVLIGAGNIGTRIAEILIKNSIPTVLIESEKLGKFSEDIRRQLPSVEGNPKNIETLLQANIKKAKAAICVTDNDVDNLSIIQKIKALNPEIYSEISIFDKEMAIKLKNSLNEESIVSSPLIAANYFIASLFFQGVLFSTQYKNSLIIISSRNNMKTDSNLEIPMKALKIDYKLNNEDLLILEIPLS